MDPEWRQLLLIVSIMLVGHHISVVFLYQLENKFNATQNLLSSNKPL